MDEIKDIQTGTFLKSLDGQIRTNPFGENRTAERAYRRAERLVAAIFLLTNHIPSNEPIRREIRKYAPELLTQILDLRADLRSSASEKITRFQATVRQLISLVKMLMFSGYISPQNAEAATEALDELGNFIAIAQRSNLSDTIRLSREDLLDVRTMSETKIKDIKDISPIKDKKDIKDTHPSASSPRIGAILDVLKTNGESNIRDISALVPEYSEKTIQRELNELIRQGRVIRTGLRRWSRYSLLPQ